jgi:hypothetical protein
MSQLQPADESNPYAPPREPAASPGDELIFDVPDDSAERLRKTYAAAEATVQAIGLYFYLGAASSVISAVLAIASPRYTQAITERAGAAGNVAMAPAMMRVIMVVGGVFGVAFNLFLGWSLRKLYAWARWIVVVVSAIGILGVIQSMFVLRMGLTVDTVALGFTAILQIYLIVRLLGAGTGIVTSDRYRSAVIRTPELKPSLGVPDWVFLGTAAAVLGGLLVANLARAMAIE